jgi:aminopeptidase YwaD
VSPGRVRRLGAALAVVVALASAGCTGEATAPEANAPAPTSSPTASPTDSPEDSPAAVPSAAALTEPTPTPTETAPAEPPRLRADDLEPGIAMRAVRHLAGRIGPRNATSPAYQQAVRWVAGELRALEYRVRPQMVRVPAGDSWGVPVEAGTSANVVAVPPGASLSRPHLVVGAHLDTVAAAPGAEDNASGVGVLLAAAAAVAERHTRLPVVFVAFGAEEPRGPGDDDHHYGSRAYVADLSARQRAAIRGMVSLDRVGVGGTVPVGSASAGDPVQRALLAAARRAGVPALADAFSRSSDHWSFVRAGLPGARLGSTPYAEYHSPSDTVDVVNPDQLARTGRIVLAWLR